MRFSVIIPVFNAEKTLRRCLDSLTPQMTEETEIILIDDGSTDGSKSICLDYQSRCPGIRYKYQRNGGSSSARNAGIAEAAGEYVTFVDSDDYVSAHYFSTLENQSEADLLFFSVQTEKNGVPNESISSESLVSAKDYPDFLTRFVRLRNGSPCNKRFRRDLLLQAEVRFPEDLFIGEDYVFCVRYLMAAKSAAVSLDVLYHADESGRNSLSRRFNAQATEQALLNYAYCERAIKDSSLPDSVKTDLLQWQDHNRYRTAFACVLELFKQPQPSYRSLRSEIRTVLRSFHREEQFAPVNTAHRMMALCVERCWTLPAYCIAKARYKQRSKG